MADIVIFVCIVGAVGAIVGKKVKDRKAGRTACGCGCCGCSGCGEKKDCHQ